MCACVRVDVFVRTDSAAAFDEELASSVTGVGAGAGAGAGVGAGAAAAPSIDFSALALAAADFFLRTRFFFADVGDDCV